MRGNFETFRTSLKEVSYHPNLSCIWAVFSHSPYFVIPVQFLLWWVPHWYISRTQVWVLGGVFSYYNVCSCWLGSFAGKCTELRVGGSFLTSKQPFTWSVSRMRSSGYELLVINPFHLHSSVAWHIDWSVLLFHLLAQANRHRALPCTITTLQSTVKCPLKLNHCVFLAHAGGESGDVYTGLQPATGQVERSVVLEKGGWVHMVVLKGSA
jgi:hypothetical protein